MQKATFYILLATTFSLSYSVPAVAGPADGGAKAKAGVVRCGGNNFLRLFGSEIHAAFYQLRNFDSAVPITIDRMRFFDASGAVLVDSAVTGLPETSNGILGPTDNTLEPNQTAQFDSNSILPFLSQPHRPIQLEIQWSSSSKALALDASFVRTARARDPGTGDVGEDRARHLRECTTISLN